MKLSLIVACATACVSCAPRLDLTPTIFLDSSFTQDELVNVYGGLRAWETALPGEVLFQVALDDRASMAEMAGHGQDVVYIFRSREDCPSSLPHEDAGMFWGYSELGQHVNGVICFDAGTLDVNSLWKRAAMHEVGHALGLQHAEEPSVMTPGLD